MTERLARATATPEQVDAIVITHAHGDHTRGALLFSKRHGVPIYTTETVRADWSGVKPKLWQPLRTQRVTRLGGFQFRPLAIPHDASETLAFRIDTEDGAIGFATDVGTVTTDLVEQFQDCDVLVIESNHAVELLRVSPYAASTRARIGGSRGHLSNEALAEFIRVHLGASVRCVVLAHLSRVNNVPEIAELTCREALSACGRDDVRVVVARQDHPSPTIDLGTWRSRRSRPLCAAQTVLPFEPKPTPSRTQRARSGSRP